MRNDNIENALQYKFYDESAAQRFRALSECGMVCAFIYSPNVFVNGEIKKYDEKGKKLIDAYNDDGFSENGADINNNPSFGFDADTADVAVDDFEMDEDALLPPSIAEVIEDSDPAFKENNKETLAQVFTDIRYTKKNNEFFSEKLWETIKASF